MIGNDFFFSNIYGSLQTSTDFWVLASALEFTFIFTLKDIGMKNIPTTALQ